MSDHEKILIRWNVLFGLNKRLDLRRRWNYNVLLIQFTPCLFCVYTKSLHEGSLSLNLTNHDKIDFSPVQPQGIIISNVFTQPNPILRKEHQFQSVCVFVCVFVFPFCLSDDRSPLLMDRSSSNLVCWYLVSRWRRPIDMNFHKFALGFLGVATMTSPHQVGAWSVH